MAEVDDHDGREHSSLSERYELEIDDETDSPRRLNDSLTPESGIELESRATDLTGKGDEKTFIPDEEPESSLAVKPNEMFQFDLTNPDEVMRMLETVDLSEEDTDVLLEEAYNVNKKLKMMLQKKGEEKEFNHAEASLVNGSSVIMVPGKSVQSRANSNTRTNSNSRANSNTRTNPSTKTMPSQCRVASGTASRENLFAKNVPLPPIKDINPHSLHPTVGNTVDAHASSVYSAKLRRPAPPSAGGTPTRNALSSQGPGRRVVPHQGLMDELSLKRNIFRQTRNQRVPRSMNKFQ
ncbi:uncharacterized protein LOC110445549 isoform X2 [Mizuhopecten yessoensis]|uniref:uncharacterized protein LOC110445549 isoform X2 n=1 Tax=Mizuhopecten yessoensis TaxID=6573 RepID=UPI000B45C735|nr:uncharacterized protein LOC110445549 isoform X2 [Mizuhopecten yessoensis]